MPGKNVIKPYIVDGDYHIYNRGVEKRNIFLDSQDYKVFLSYLKIYLEPPTKPKPRIVKIGNYTFSAPGKPLKNHHNYIELLAYCLMPNHFHLLIHQKSERAIESFMRSLATKYSVYFNKRYDRVGSLFQGTYKAIFVENESYLLHLSRYIHLNPIKNPPVKDAPLQGRLLEAFSSYEDYLGKRKTNWLKTELILSYFKTTQKTSLKDVFSYQSFVEDYFQNPEDILGDLTID